MKSKRDEWKRGVAFVRGINFYKNLRITKEEMLKLCRKVEDDNLRIIKIVKTDNIIFEKRNMHYATVGQLLEKILSEHFGKPVYVTTRSMRTIKSLIEEKVE